MSEFDQKAFAERLIKIRRDYLQASTSRKFAEALGIDHTLYNGYEKDTSPTLSVLQNICNLTGADPVWLMTGSGSTDKKHRHINKELLDKIESLLKVMPGAQEAVEAFVDLLIENNCAQGKGLQESGKAQRHGWIPILGRTAAGIVHFWSQSSLPGPEEAAVQLEKMVEKYTSIRITKSISKKIVSDQGMPISLAKLHNSTVSIIDIVDPDRDVEGNQFMRFVEAKPIQELFPDAFALQIDGDSMSPTINDGDIVILSPSVTASQGRAAVVCLKGQIGVTCKKIRKNDGIIHLVPTNPEYPVQKFTTDKIHWAMAVLCHIAV